MNTGPVDAEKTRRPPSVPTAVQPAAGDIERPGPGTREGVVSNRGAYVRHRSRDVWLATPSGSEDHQSGVAGVTTMNRDFGDGDHALRDELERLTASKLFCRSERLCTFLRFIVDRHLQDPAETVKEYLIATEVYGRPASFDPRFDPIVRVEARRLRTKLQEYYRTEGRDDLLELSLPVGAYVPVIRVRSSAGEPGADPPALAYVTVAPFVVLGAEDGHSEFRDALFEEIVHALYAEGVCVCLSQPGWRDEALPCPGMDERPTGYTLLQGTLREIGDDIRIWARLTSTADREVMWSQIYSLRTHYEFSDLESIACAMASDVHDITGRV